MNARKSSLRTEPPTADRLRIDIDEGRTSDKVRYPDPAAAPLGSDDEAAGTPPTAEQRRLAQENREHHEAPLREGPGTLLIYALLIAGVALVIIGIIALMQM